MAAITYAITIRAPQEVVFGYVADWGNAVRYVPNLTSLELVGSVSHGLGTRLRGEVRILSFSLESESEVVEFASPRRIVTRSTGGLANRGEWLFEPETVGTNVTAVVDYDLSGLFLGRLVRALVRRQLETDVRRSLENLRTLLEGGD